MNKKDLKIGDRVILTDSYDRLKKGSEGIIRGFRNNAQIEVTKNIGAHDLHTCDGLIPKVNGERVGYNVPIDHLELIEELPSIDMDFGDTCSSSIEDFLKGR